MLLILFFHIYIMGLSITNIDGGDGVVNPLDNEDLTDMQEHCSFIYINDDYE